MTDAIRNRAKTLLLHDPTIDNEEIAVDLEKGIFNWCVDFCESSANVRKNSLEDFENVYSDKFKSVMINMYAPTKHLGLPRGGDEGDITASVRGGILDFPLGKAIL